MSTQEESDNSKEISVRINNQSIKNEIDLIRSEQRIINNSDNSLSMRNDINNQNIINNNLTNNLDNTKDSALDLIYGVPYEINHPRKIGNLRVLFYLNNFPLIVIGSKCK